MVNRPETQLAFEGTEGGFNVGQLNVAGPQHRGVLRRQIGAQQIVAIAPLSLLQLDRIDAEMKRRARDRFGRRRQYQRDEAERTARLFFGRSDAQQ